MRSLLLALLFVAAPPLFSQDCFPTPMTISSSVGSGGPTFLSWQLLDDEGGDSGSGMAQFNLQTTSVTQFGCLQPGCYTFTGTYNDDIVPFSTFLNVQPEGGYVNVFDIFWEGPQMIVEFCIVANGECELDVQEIASTACNEIVLEAVNYNENAQLVWSVNGVPQDAEDLLTFGATEPGTFLIEAAYETPDCPQGVFWSGTFVIDETCFETPGACTLEFTAVADDCLATLEVTGNEGYIVQFFVNDVLVSEGQDLLFFELPDQPIGIGVNYTFCVVIVGDGPCAGTEWCETIALTSCLDCGIYLNYEETECGQFTFTSDVPSGWQDVHWTVNEQPQPGLVWQQNLELATGEYTVCAWFDSPSCGAAEQCVTIIVDCEQATCALELATAQGDPCGNVQFTALNYPGGAVVEWFINDSYAGQGASFEYVPVASGEVEVCAAYETPECSQGAFACTTLSYAEDCFENECPFNFEVATSGCSAFLYLSGASPDGLIYSVTNEVVAENVMGIDHNFGGNGEFEVCAEVTQGLCAGEIFCQTVLIDDCDECIELTILIENNSNNLPDEMIIDALLNYIEIFAGFDVVFTVVADGAWGITACLPAACYECQIGLPEFPFSDYQIDFIVADEVVYEYTVSAAVPTHTFDLSVGEDCTTGVAERDLDPIVNVYPNPANEQVTIAVDGEGVYAYSLFDLAGRMVANGSLTAGAPNMLRLSALPAGVYLLDLSGGAAPLRTRIIVTR